jgi:hypothetical protein
MRDDLDHDSLHWGTHVPAWLVLVAGLGALVVVLLLASIAWVVS